jgi:cystathionine beta-lyase/cystathionine gamma-synthase
LGGQVVIKNQKFFQKIWDYRSTFGGIIDPFAAYLKLRSLKTYALRFSRMTENTKKILEYLSNFDEVKNIWYPGEYKNKNQDARFKKYFLNGGAVISFETKKIDSIRNFGKLKHFKMAPSFGSLESLIEWPYYMSYFGQPKKILKKLNITKNLIRMSVGIENIEFLQKDIKKLLKK